MILIQPCIKVKEFEVEETFSTHTCEKECYIHAGHPSNYCSDCGGKVSLRDVTHTTTKSYLDLIDDADALFESQAYDGFMYLFANQHRYKSAIPDPEFNVPLRFDPDDLVQEMDDFKRHYAEEIERIKEVAPGEIEIIYAVLDAYS